MKLSPKIVFALVCAVAVCCAQSDPISSSGIPPGSKGASAPEPPGQVQATVAQPTQNPPVASPEAGAQAPQPKVQTAQAGKPPAGARKAYVIGPLDVLTVKVWNNPNLSGLLDVGPDGMISMQLIGEVKADGLTTSQLKEKLTERLSEFLNSPLVDVTLAKNNSKHFYVYGGVLKGGEFPLIQETTVMDALSNVGGFKEFANTKKIRIQRGTQEFNFNYKDVSQGKHMEQNILLQNGDRIFVKE